MLRPVQFNAVKPLLRQSRNKQVEPLLLKILEEIPSNKLKNRDDVHNYIKSQIAWPMSTAVRDAFDQFDTLVKRIHMFAALYEGNDYQFNDSTLELLCGFYKRQPSELTKQALQRYFLGGMRIQEIQEVLEMPQGNASRRVKQAKTLANTIMAVKGALQA